MLFLTWSDVAASTLPQRTRNPSEEAKLSARAHYAMFHAGQQLECAMHSAHIVVICSSANDPQATIQITHFAIVASCGTIGSHYHEDDDEDSFIYQQTTST